MAKRQCFCALAITAGDSSSGSGSGSTIGTGIGAAGELPTKGGGTGGADGTLFVGGAYIE